MPSHRQYDMLLKKILTKYKALESRCDYVLCEGTDYTALGLVNTKEMFEKALAGKYAGAGLPIALHLDHGDSFELAKSCIDSGFSSVMLDGSDHPFDENAELTKRVVDYAPERDVTVEGELGVLSGVEDEVSHEISHYTKPEEVEEFSPRIRLNLIFASISGRPGKN